MNENNIKVFKVENNDFRIFDPLFKQSNRKQIIPKINWLCSMDILNEIPCDGKTYDLIEYLKEIRNKYEGFDLKQIDAVINFK